ncbi:hypothetical protein Mal4_58360 [Maioricimonas rarisocia]|uniref:DUF1499 domain-containing protein n=1 Tax=Maioricimonas rarisocia TaxID=2528026 RepID=A0A517ZG56_9PLAN|nr:hypothetical protein Mal4_58360 [Maioricimonas rarisocia]
MVLVAVVAVAATTVASWRRPQLGAVEGRLRPCPDSPNCVSSFEDRPSHRTEPFEVHGDPKTAVSRLVRQIDAMPGTNVVEVTDDYAHIEFVTPVLRYVDDVELLHDGASEQIHVRSASRVGRSDLGANRRRVEIIRSQWKESLEAAAVD